MYRAAVSRKVVLQTGKSLRDHVESFYGCLSEPQGVSAWWKETAQTHVFVLSHSLLLNRLNNHGKPNSHYTSCQSALPVHFNTLVG